MSSALFELAAIGAPCAGGPAVGAALAAARAGARVAFAASDAQMADVAVVQSLRRAGVTCCEASPLLARAAGTLLLESSLWRNEADRVLAVKAGAAARSAGRRIVLALGDAAGVHRQRLPLLAFLRGHADVLLCGALEACALYDANRVDSVVPLLRRDCRATVLDRGARGAIVVDAAGVRLLDAAANEGGGYALLTAQERWADPAPLGRAAPD